MKRTSKILVLILGITILLGGLLTHGLGINQMLPVPRPDLVVVGTTLIGTLVILIGLDLLSKKTKKMEILEKDERNIAINNASMAKAFKIMTVMLIFVLFALVFMGYMNQVSFFAITGVVFVGQITWLVMVHYLDKRM